MAFAAEQRAQRAAGRSSTRCCARSRGSLSRERILRRAGAPHPRARSAIRWWSSGTPDYERRVYRVVAVAWPRPAARRSRASSRSTPASPGAPTASSAPCWWPDVAQDRGLHRPRRQRAAARWRVPIFSGDEVAAVLNVESDARRGFDRGSGDHAGDPGRTGVGIIAAKRRAVRRRWSAPTRGWSSWTAPKSELGERGGPRLPGPARGRAGARGAAGVAAPTLPWRSVSSRRAPSSTRPPTWRAWWTRRSRPRAWRRATSRSSSALVDLASVARQVLERLPADERHPITLDLPEEPLPGLGRSRARRRGGREPARRTRSSTRPAGGEVRVTLGRAGDHATLGVRDHGIGIGAEDRERLFRPFSRVRDRRVAAIEGSGLGLLHLRPHGPRARRARCRSRA